MVDERIDLNIADALTLGHDLNQRARFEEALPIFEAIAKAEPSNTQAAGAIGMCLTELGRDEEALPWFDRAMALLRNELIAITSNRGKALGELGRTQDAFDCFNHILRTDPNNALALYNRGLMLMQGGNYRHAINDFDEALKRDPGNAKALFGRGFANLVLGNYEDGFRDYEFRLKDLIEEPKADLWTGEQLLDGKTILVHGEQGHGDDIMFMRYVPLMVKLGARVYLVLHPGVRPLFEGMPGTTMLSEDRATWPPFDYWVRMMSLARCFKTTATSVPPPVHLSTIPPLAASGKIFRVGLCWAGSPKSRYDKHRSIPLHLIEPLLHIPNTLVYSLMQEVRVSDREAFDRLKATHIVDGGAFLDFRDTATAMFALDHVVTVDTSVAHLAGTMGIPTSIMLTAFRTYWLWIEKRTTSPWYPSARLYRQTTDGDWASVITAVAADIRHRSSMKAA